MGPLVRFWTGHDRPSRAVILFLERLKEYYPGGFRGWVCLSTTRSLGRLHGSTKGGIGKRQRTRRGPPEICHPRHRARAGLRRPDSTRIVHLQDADRDDFADRRKPPMVQVENRNK